MGVGSVVNYVVFDNPVSRYTASFFKVSLWVLFCILCVTSTSTQGKPSVPVVPQVTVITEKTPLWKLAAESGPFVRIAAIMGASAVALGAYGAHRSYPKDKAQELKPIFETANRYHFFHSLALLGVPMCKNPTVVCFTVNFLGFVVNIFLFRLAL